MKIFKHIGLVVLLFLLCSYKTIHKYYISNTQIEYAKEKQSVQIITRLFTDDFEDVLQERYDETLVIDGDNSEIVDTYIERYLSEKFRIKIDSISKTPIFIGKEIDLDIVKCYLEIEDVKSINSIEVTNQSLFGLFNEQQNIIKLDINSKKKSLILTKQKDKALLIFD